MTRQTSRPAPPGPARLAPPGPARPALPGPARPAPPARASRQAWRLAATLALPTAVASVASVAPGHLGAAPLAAQQEEVRDSLQDALRLRLERLDRRLGDSTGLRPPDSTDMAVHLDGAASDSTLQALLSLPGYDLVHYRGESAEFETESRILTLVGADGSEALLNREGMELAADSALVFNEKTGRLTTIGQEATYRPDEGDEVLTRRLIFDIGENRGTATDVRTRMNAGMGEWIVRGDFPSVSRDVSYGHDVTFTSCEEEEPHYHFLAKELKVSPNGTLVARGVWLYFADVRVFPLPFMAQSTERGRRRGLLPITFSVNDIVRASSSYSRRISNLGYYFPLGDYADAQAALDWWSGNYVGLNGRVRYSWSRQFLEGNANFRRFWRNGGGQELAFDTNHEWRMSERSRLSVSARYASSADFVRRNSFDPREVTQSIDSEGGFSRRFDWGQVSVSANRRQFLSDDRVEMTLPTANLSLSPITLFAAPVNRARFYNNMTWSASGNFARSIRDQPDQPADQPFTLGMADQQSLRGGFNTSLSAGALTISQSASWNRNTTRDLPAGFFDPMEPLPPTGTGSVADLQRSVLFQRATSEAGDFSAQELTWSTTIDWQQTLVGSTTLTPQASFSGRSIHSDTASAGGGGFIAAPTRLSFGAQLKSDIYGFYGDGALRHKVSPTFEYSYSPATSPTPLQQATFGGRAINPRNEIRIGISQTFEAKREDPNADSATANPDAGDGPRRLQTAEKVTLLALRTSAVTYDFEEAGRVGHFTRGFADNLTLSHQVSSDYLRGLSLSLAHGLFDDSGVTADAGSRRFAPFLSSVNLSFSMSNQSALFRWIGRRGGDESEPTPEPEADEESGAADPTGFQTADLGDATVVPGAGDDRAENAQRQRPQPGEGGKWDASLSYSLARVRGSDAAPEQMLQGSLRFQPTDKWSVDWNTSYNVAAGGFNDHVIRLTRDLHRWEADFAFRQTAAGNWSFMFEVALSDNRDLHFDYEQRTGGDYR